MFKFNLCWPGPAGSDAEPSTPKSMSDPLVMKIYSALFNHAAEICVVFRF
jgi:hypothetical protein